MNRAFSARQKNYQQPWGGCPRLALNGAVGAGDVSRESPNSRASESDADNPVRASRRSASPFPAICIVRDRGRSRHRPNSNDALPEVLMLSGHQLLGQIVGAFIHVFSRPGEMMIDSQFG